MFLKLGGGAMLGVPGSIPRRVVTVAKQTLTMQAKSVL